MNKKVVIALSVVMLVIIGVLVYMMMKPQQIEQYAVTFSYGNGTTTKVYIEDGKVVSKPVTPTMDGYTFVGWELNGVPFDFTTPITEDTMLVAKYEKIEEDKDEETKVEYTVKFETDGGGAVVEQKVKEGEKVTKPQDPAKTGYKFKGWKLNGDDYDFTKPVTANMSLIAVWEKIETVTVTFNTDGGSSVKAQTIEKGKTATRPSNPTKTGYRFKEWTLDGKAYNFKNTVSKNITLKATWEKVETITVTFDTDGGSSIKAQTVEKGKAATKPANPTRTGYRFKEWTLDGKVFNFSTKLDKNVTLKAVWEKIEYVTVTFNTDGGSSVKEQTIEKGKVATKPADPTRSGYKFKGWELNGTTYNFSSAVNTNITIKAVWEKVETVTVTFNTDGGSNVKEQTIEKGKTATKPTNPTKAGYTFAGWTLNGAAYNFSSAVNNNITLKATWTQKTFTAKVTKVDDYSTDRYITIYQEGSAITVSGIYYTNGTRIPTAASGNKLTVAAAEITGVTTIKVKLTSGSMVTATIQ